MKKIPPWINTILTEIMLIVAETRNLRKLTFSHPNLWEMEVLVATPDEMKKINKKFRGISAPTDILSFENLASFRESGQLGSLIICLEEIKKNQKVFKTDRKTETAAVLTHGVLHLLGFDHEVSQKESNRMTLWEKKILKKLKINTKSLIQRVSTL